MHSDSIILDEFEVVKSWTETMVDKVTKLGYRAIPVLTNNSPMPFGDGQTYPPGHSIWSRAKDNEIAIALDGLVLADDDGHKRAGAITAEDLATIAADYDEFDVTDWLAAKAQDNAKGSAHFIFKAPGGVTLRGNQHGQSERTGKGHYGWDFKTGNQLCYIKESKQQNLLPVDRLQTAPFYLTDNVLAPTKDTADDDLGDFADLIVDETFEAADPDHWFVTYMVEHHGYEVGTSDSRSLRLVWPGTSSGGAGTCVSIVNDNIVVKSFDSSGLTESDEAISAVTCVARLENIDDSTARAKLSHIKAGVFDYVPDGRDEVVAQMVKDAGSFIYARLDVEAEIDEDLVRKFLSVMMYDANKNKFYMLHPLKPVLIGYGRGDTIAMMNAHYGNPLLNSSKIAEAVDEDEFIASKAEAREINNKVHNTILTYLMAEQVNIGDIWHETDMFADANSVRFDDGGRASVNYMFQPLPRGEYNPAVIDEYKAFFPEVDDVLKFIVAARFASNRKSAYLWIQAPSNWGKDVFQKCIGNLIVKADAEEIKMALKGQPSGFTVSEFGRCMALCINEFNHVNKELKQLEDSLSFAPKGEPRASVPLYAKLFFSKDNVSSLVTENGVEEQFANRFCYIDGRGRLDDLKLFQSLGGFIYINSLMAYFAEVLNDEVERYRELGDYASATEGDFYLKNFHRRYGIGEKHGHLDLEGVGSELRNEILRAATFEDLVVCEKTGDTYLKRPGKNIREAIDEYFDKSEKVTFSKAVSELTLHISVDNQPVRLTRVNGKPMKVLLIKKATGENSEVTGPEKVTFDDLGL